MGDNSLSENFVSLPSPDLTRGDSKAWEETLRPEWKSSSSWTINCPVRPYWSRPWGKRSLKPLSSPRPKRGSSKIQGTPVPDTDCVSGDIGIVGRPWKGLVTNYTNDLFTYFVPWNSILRQVCLDRPSPTYLTSRTLEGWTRDWVRYFYYSRGNTSRLREEDGIVFPPDRGEFSPLPWLLLRDSSVLPRRRRTESRTP